MGALGTVRGLILGSLVRCRLGVDQEKGSKVSGPSIKIPFNLFPPFWHSTLNQRLDLSSISAILSLLTFCPLSYGCPVKPDSKAGCTLLQFFSKYDQGPQVEKLAGCLV